MANVEIVINSKLDRHPFLQPLGAIRNKSSEEAAYFHRLLRTLPRAYSTKEVLFFDEKQALFDRMRDLEYDPANQVLSYDPKDIAKNVWSDLVKDNRLSIEKVNTRIVSFSPEKVVVELEENRTSDTLLILANHYHPHWRAFLDNSSVGQETSSSFLSWRTKKELKHFPINFLLNGYRIPKDVNRIVLSFSPPYLWVFHAITMLNYLLLAAILCYLFRKRIISLFLFLKNPRKLK